jgi:two-component system, OmpR family, phosphate regulon sensor histidine kinase PhoR
MKKRSIWLIIILMSTAVLGVSFIQIFWINWSLDINEKSFDDKVYNVLNKVKERLVVDAMTQEEYNQHVNEVWKRIENESRRILENIEEESIDLDKEKINQELWSNYLLLGAADILDNIDNRKLQEYLNFELENQGLVLEHEYGVFSNKTGGFIILNGNYVAEVTTDLKATIVSEGRSLKESKYKIALFESLSDHEPGYMAIYFPNKSPLIGKKIVPILLLSILFTLLILFCFAYTVHIIFKQKKLSEMKNDFINNMTHEFKTPIATISLAVDSISSPMILGSQEKTKRFLNIIKEENKRMLSQVEKVLQMATIERREYKLHISEFNVHEAIEMAVENASLRVKSRNGEITKNLKASRAVIHADKTHVASMINNLLDNAEKYTVVVPKIVVTTENYQNGIKISVKDNGIGIDKDAQKFIFDKFYRVHTGNLHDVKGFGLGLSYVKLMTDAHGGQVFVKSELGKGSTFSIYLPFKTKTA